LDRIVNPKCREKAAANREEKARDEPQDSHHRR
jgi:hypothetical protein